jgi:catechol 2,3-dioxygenase-like lactoylglutathione lyase family enzyme
MKTFLTVIGVGVAVIGHGTFGEAAITVSRVGCPNIPVTSLERSISFFRNILDFERVKEEDSSKVARLAPKVSAKAAARTARLALGDECIDLTEYTDSTSKAFPVDSHGNDFWFQHIAIVVSDMDKAYARLRGGQVRFVSNLPQTLPDWNKNAAGISAFYFRDPDGHYLELIHFPNGKGQSKWQNRADKLFLGIDHSAITVSNTAKSLEFYRDKLHLRVVGGSENYGNEQEHLSGVFNAHVLITSLRSPSGMGIEFLEYLSPVSGRSTPESWNTTDIPVWQTSMEVQSPEANDSTANADRVNDLNGTDGDNIQWRKLPGNAGQVAWVKDPDGHVLKLIKK